MKFDTEETSFHIFFYSELTGQRFLNSFVGVRAEYCPRVISRRSMGAPSSRNMKRYTMMKTTPPYFSVRIGNSHRLCAPERETRSVLEFCYKL